MFLFTSNCSEMIRPQFLAIFSELVVFCFPAYVPTYFVAVYMYIYINYNYNQNKNIKILKIGVST